jgi:hypothetical protein
MQPIARLIFVWCLVGGVALAEEVAKPRIAFFPLAGTSIAELREKTGFALRAKLDRTGMYEVIDGAKMADVAGQAEEPITLGSKPGALMELNKLLDANILVWGEMSNQAAGATVRLKILDLREGPSAKPREISKVIKQPTDLRFVTEEILQTLPGVKPFAHPPEESVVNDAKSEEMWKKYPNMVYDGDFSEAGHWQAIYMAEKYAVEISSTLPAVDKVNIFKLNEGGQTNNVLAMNLSRTCAENNGMACLSDRIEISANTRYRITYRYKSDGPTLHVFVKGYTEGQDIKGDKAEREIYRRQVPPSGATHGKWVTVVDDFNPQHVAFPVKWLRVDLYAYLSPGMVMFDDVTIKPVGKPTRKAEDEAIKKPVTRPIGGK